MEYNLSIHNKIYINKKETLVQGDKYTDIIITNITNALITEMWFVRGERVSHARGVNYKHLDMIPCEWRQDMGEVLMYKSKRRVQPLEELNLFAL